MIKHTPGPWSIFSDEPRNYYAGIEADGFSIVVIGYPDEFDDSGVRGRTTDETKANAHLIAAAPELLQALENLLCEYEDRECQFGDDYLWVKHEDKITIDHARLTIAKAKGETK